MVDEVVVDCGLLVVVELVVVEAEVELVVVELVVVEPKVEDVVVEVVLVSVGDPSRESASHEQAIAAINMKEKQRRMLGTVHGGNR